MAAEDREERDLNRDPITDEPGAHPVGTGVGATGGAVAGAAAGAIGGPLGMAVGGVVGAVVGGLAGKAAAEAINPTAEEAHWRENYTREPYYEQGRSFDDYGPAYRHGLNARLQHEGDWDSAEPRLSSEWQTARSGSGLTWDQAKPASRAAWDRADRIRHGGMGSGDPALAGASDGMRGSLGMSGASPMVGGTDMGGGSMGMDQDIGGRSSSRGMGTTGMETGNNVMMDSSYNTAGMEHRTGTAGTGMGSTGTGAAGMGQQRGTTQHDTAGTGTGTGVNTGVTGMVGAAQSAGNTGGDTKDVIDALQDLVECCKDGEYGFQSCAEQAQRADLKSLFLQRADDCRRGAQQLNEEIRKLGGKTEDGGSTLGAVHRGWVAVKTALSTYDDQAVLNEAERGEDNALARYRKALKQNLPPHIHQLVERQFQGVQRNHDQVKMLRDSAKAS